MYYTPQVYTTILIWDNEQTPSHWQVETNRAMWKMILWPSYDSWFWSGPPLWESRIYPESTLTQAVSGTSATVFAPHSPKDSMLNWQGGSLIRLPLGNAWISTTFTCFFVCSVVCLFVTLIYTKPNKPNKTKLGPNWSNFVLCQLLSTLITWSNLLIKKNQKLKNN